MLNVLWADDDALDTLEPVGRLIKKLGGFSLTVVRDFHEAIEQLNDSRKAAENQRLHALLIDTILPPGMKATQLGQHLGVEVARRAAEDGVPAVAFLSVVPFTEVVDQFKELERIHPGTRFSYFDKLSLFEGVQLKSLVERLSKSKPREKES